ncbi:hypothetical protein JB92DRAFT_2871310 [Gautieria morchelliformis]|nr:hypothetical protein JB92DRAFT_2871310 [Gautieria morchelliformis]
MSISSHLEMKYPRETNMALNHAAAGFLFYVTRYYVPIGLSVITASVTTNCKTVGPLGPAFLTVIVIASSILLLLRVYALYNRNKWILGYLGSVIVIQLAVCIFVFTFPGRGSLPMPPIDIPVFQACVNHGEFAPIILELMYDVSIVALIIAKTWKDRSLDGGLRYRGWISRIIFRDGIIYFLVIFSTMFTWLWMGLFAPFCFELLNIYQIGLKFVNAYPSEVLVPIMINRLTIHLHRSVKSNYRTSLTPSAVQIPFLPTWMINTQDYSSGGDIDNAAI